MLSLPSLQDWDMKGTTLPLVYYKTHLLNQNRIQSNMQFILRWKGHGYPSMEFVTLHLSGALLPKEVAFFTNTIEDEDKNHAVHVEKHLDTTNLKQVLSLLKSNNYDASTWHDLCFSLGLPEETLNTIEADKNNVNDRLRTCLHKWLKGADKLGEATWTSLEKALKDIDQKRVAENLRKSKVNSEL